MCTLGLPLRVTYHVHVHVHKRVPVDRLPSSGHCTNLIINQLSYKMKNGQSWRIGSILRKGISNYLQKKKKKKKSTELRNSSPWMKLEVWRKWPLTAVGSRRKRRHGNFMWFLGMALVDFSRDKNPYHFCFWSIFETTFQWRRYLLEEETNYWEIEQYTLPKWPLLKPRGIKIPRHWF